MVFSFFLFSFLLPLSFFQSLGSADSNLGWKTLNQSGDEKNPPNSSSFFLFVVVIFHPVAQLSDDTGKSR